MRLVHFLPNTFTLLNGLSGCMALVAVVQDNPKMTLIWVLIGVFFDSIDGFVARAFGATSEIGKQLDSLCDVVSFGAVPGMFMFRYLSDCLPYNLIPLAVLGFLVTLAVIYRLARFNITPSTQLGFEGMPSPAFALFVVGIPFLPIVIDPLYITAAVALLALLMVSKVPLPSQKFVKGRPTYFAIVFALLALPVLILYRSQALSAVVLAYAVTGVIYMKLKK
jgi:CDP-diacylglycerol--serine O-phosphatidyltransferase